MTLNQFAQSFPTTAAVRYDRALDKSLQMNPPPPALALPRPTKAWPKVNVELLEQYRTWLAEGGASRSVIDQHRIPMAGHVLGLNLKPHRKIDLTTDFDKAMAFIQARQKSTSWERNCRHSLDWFRRFLQQQRGIVVVNFDQEYGNAARYQEGLPQWLLDWLERFLHLRQANWRKSRLAESTYQFWQKYTRIWRWLYENECIDDNSIITDVTPAHIYDYIDAMLTAGYAASSVNVDLHNFQSFLRFLQQRNEPIPERLLAIPSLKTPNSLPRFLTDEQVGKLRNDLKERVAAANTPVRVRDRRLDLAVFYLLWQAGLRVCEVEDLELADMDLEQQRLTIRQSKGLKDRTMYLTDAAKTAVIAYLEVRGPADCDNVFIYRHKPMSKDLVRCRLKAAGRRTGVKVTPHMLRHTFGTQLINAGCRITTIQALLGHERLNTTLTYARVHNKTVAEDYYAAMSVIEKRLEPVLYPPETLMPEENGHGPEANGSAAHLLELVTDLQDGPLTESQQDIVAQLQQGLASLVKPVNGVPLLMDYVVVNEPVM